MNPFDIVIIYLSWGDSGKSRPVLVIAQENEKIAAFPITTQYETKSEQIRKNYFKIDDWEQSGLDKESYVDTGNMLKLPQKVFDSKTPVGQLTINDKLRFLDFIK